MDTGKKHYIEYNDKFMRDDIIPCGWFCNIILSLFRYVLTQLSILTVPQPSPMRYIHYDVIRGVGLTIPQSAQGYPDKVRVR